MIKSSLISDLAVNGGSYCGPVGSQSNLKVDMSGVGSLSINPTSNPLNQRITAQQIREKNNASNAKYVCFLLGGREYFENSNVCSIDVKWLHLKQI